MSQVLTFSPKDVTILLSSYQLTGVMSAEIEWVSTPFVFHRGIRGVHTRTFSSDLCGTIRIRLQQTSIGNDVLWSILEQDRLNRSARLDITIKDTKGKTLYQSNQAYVRQFPKLTLSTQLEDRIWEIDAFNFVMARMGGDAGAGFDIFSSVTGALDLLTGSASDLISSATDAVSSAADSISSDISSLF